MEDCKNKKIRESNMELLRIVAMFMVLIVHADFWALGWPTKNEYLSSVFTTSSRILLEGLSFVCVNVFVLLSGWYSIKASKKSFLKFIFQCVFVVSFCTLLRFFVCNDTNFKSLGACFFLLKNQWFVKAYICLYLLSPIINYYTERANKKEFKMLIISFFLFQTIWGWAFGATRFFVDGYTPLSFIGLYLLARYVKIYTPDFSTKSCMSDLLSYLALSSIITFIYISSFYLECGRLTIVFSYISPFVILASLYLLLFFSKLTIVNRVVNWVAASSFTVFLVHTSPMVADYYRQICIFLYSNNSGFTCLFLFLAFVIVVFIISVLMDQVRIFIWNYLYSRIID